MGKTVLLLILFSIVVCFIAENQTEAFLSFRATKKFTTKATGTSEFDASELLSDHMLEESETDVDLKKEADKIERLPGQPEVTFKQYGGYVTVDSKAGRALYYYFVEAADDQHSHTLPLLLWLNGGPGCSSLGYGAMTELGPFRVKSDGKTLYINEYAWNQVANVLFLESPAGVGFSYSNNTAELKTGNDKRTAINNYVFLIKWLDRFPEYKNRSFYIAGESYAGHYAPQLAQTIFSRNKNAKTIVNLKGVILGNADIDDETVTKGTYEYFGSHALISDDTAHQITKYCDFSPSATELSGKCVEAITEADKTFDRIDPYNIYGPRCSNPKLTYPPKKTSMFEFDPCSDSYVKAYLNRPDVQNALHANVTYKITNHEWEGCNVALFRNWIYVSSSALPLLKSFMNNGIRVWVYSGDVDGVVPVTATQLALEKMKLRIKNAWQPWYDDKEDHTNTTTNKEVAGYTQDYVGNLTFATVRGAGHQVPSLKPQRALSLVTHFLADTKLPRNI